MTQQNIIKVQKEFIELFKLTNPNNYYPQSDDEILSTKSAVILLLIDDDMVDYIVDEIHKKIKLLTA